MCLILFLWLFVSQVLLALSLGVDLISTNYPEALSSKGHALALDVSLLYVAGVQDSSAMGTAEPGVVFLLLQLILSRLVYLTALSFIFRDSSWMLHQQPVENEISHRRTILIIPPNGRAWREVLPPPQTQQYPLLP